VEFGTGVSQAGTPSGGVVAFSSDENVALMLGAGYVTVDRQTWSSQVHYRQTIGVFPLDKTDREICPWWSLDKNVLICGDGYGNPPVAGIQVWNVSAGTEKSANSDWAAAQGLVSDTTPIVFADDTIVTLHHQALVFDQAGKVTQVGYVDMDTPSTIASVSARDADWWSVTIVSSAKTIGVVGAESKTALNELIAVLHDNPNVTIEMASHTDRWGSDAYNINLSERRAKSVVDYLVENGISRDRLQPHGYGKSRPKTVTKRIARLYPQFKEGDILTEEFIKTLSEEDQQAADQINRRTEFSVLSLTYNMK
jgi:hypothetical protein